MEYALLVVANYAFFVLHFALMAFSMVGWAFKSTRVWQLWAMVLTAASWFILGPWLYGVPGVCVCTDWHNRIRTQLELPHQYNFIQMLGQEWFGVTLPLAMSEGLALGVFVQIFVAMLLVWGNVGYCAWRERSAHRRVATEPAAVSAHVGVNGTAAVRTPEPVLAGGNRRARKKRKRRK